MGVGFILTGHIMPSEWSLGCLQLESGAKHGFQNVSPPKACPGVKVVKNRKKFKKRPKMAKIPFWWVHIIKIIGIYVWNKFRNIFGIFWPFFGHFRFFTDFAWNFLKNSKKPLFDLWGPLWWVPHAFLALNQWIRPKKRGTKKSVPPAYPNEGANFAFWTTFITFFFISSQIEQNWWFF